MSNRIRDLKVKPEQVCWDEVQQLQKTTEPYYVEIERSQQHAQQTAANVGAEAPFAFHTQFNQWCVQYANGGDV